MGWKKSVAEKKESRFFLFIKRVSNPLFLALSTVILTVSGAFAGNYSWMESWGKTDGSAADFIAWLLTNAYLGFFIGGTVLFLNELGRHYKTKDIERENKTINAELEVNKGLAQALNDHQQNIQNLNWQISDLQNKIAIIWLKQAFKQHEFNSTERATIYFELNNEFSLLARYSPNPELNKIHRQKFSLNQGVISHAWRHGFYIENECPNFEDSEEIYYEYMSSKYQFDRKELLNFQMKSCSYVAVAIRNVDDHIGVVVFESIDKEKLSQIKLQELKDYCETYQPYLAEFIQKSKTLEVAKRMDSARTMGNADSDMLDSLSAKGGNS